MPNDDYYVYLLVEERPECEEVFYVGKGKNTRGAAHLHEYVRSVMVGDEGRDELTLAGVLPLSSTPGHSAESSSGELAATMVGEPAEEHARLQRIRHAHEAGHGVRVDLLRTPISPRRLRSPSSRPSSTRSGWIA
jgi:hypothetical protein